MNFQSFKVFAVVLLAVSLVVSCSSSKKPKSTVGVRSGVPQDVGSYNQNIQTQEEGARKIDDVKKGLDGEIQQVRDSMKGIETKVDGILKSADPTTLQGISGISNQLKAHDLALGQITPLIEGLKTLVTEYPKMKASVDVLDKLTKQLKEDDKSRDITELCLIYMSTGNELALAELNKLNSDVAKKAKEQYNSKPAVSVLPAPKPLPQENPLPQTPATSQPAPTSGPVVDTPVVGAPVETASGGDYIGKAVKDGEQEIDKIFGH